MSRPWFLKIVSVLMVLTFVAASCGDDDSGTTESATTEAPADEPAATEAPADEPAATEAPADEPAATEAPADEPEPEGSPLVALGLWDDGPCDPALDTLHVGITTVFETPVLTLIDQTQALEASAVAFNARGGANGHCIEVTTCDDGADPNQAVECVRELDDAGVAATINDTSSFGGADVSAGMAAAGIARFAISPGQDDYGDTNSYPFDAGGTGTSIMMPQGLVNDGVTKIAIVRVDSPAATALGGFYEAIFGDNGVEVVLDVPVPGGTTDFSQFALAAEAAGAEGIVIPLGGQEATQVLAAAQQVGSTIPVSGSLGTFSTNDLRSLGDYAENILLNAAIPPALADDPVVDLLAADLEASGVEALERDNLKSSPMRSWVGLYALLHILRDSGSEDFSRENIKALVEASGPIPMLGLTADWTPKTDHAGAFLRTGNSDYSFWTYDPAADTYNKVSDANFDTVICGTPFGGDC